MSDCVSQIEQELNNRIKQAADNVRSRHELHPASHLISDSLHRRLVPALYQDLLQPSLVTLLQPIGLVMSSA